MATTLASSPWAYELVRVDDGRLILTVVCGTVGLYELSLELDADEVAAWDREGVPYIRDFAALIAVHPSRFWPRHLGEASGESHPPR